VYRQKEKFMVYTMGEGEEGTRNLEDYYTHQPK
jgi:hypothetical protein